VLIGLATLASLWLDIAPMDRLYLMPCRQLLDQIAAADSQIAR